ncbi:hypothetical protein L393_00116 [Klebsiella pneumoniae MGH 47]|nr:hypothetical protein L393_00116 [Klebsiella pneumoniae MGH 47]
MPVHDPSSESFDWETIFESSDRCGETVARTYLFGQRRTSQFSYYNMSAHNVYYVKCNVVLNNVIFDSCLFPHQHYDRHSFHARECCAIRQNVRGDKISYHQEVPGHNISQFRSSPKKHKCSLGHLCFYIAVRKICYVSSMNDTRATIHPAELLILLQMNTATVA